MSIIRKPFELVVQSNIKALIYGQPGIGKTTAALSAPSPLLLDFDGGVHRIAPVHQTDTVQITKWEDVQEVMKEDLSAYRTIVIDTAGKMLDYMSAYIIRQDPKAGKKDGSLALQGYGTRKSMFINFLKQVSVMGKHVIFVAHDREEKNGDDRIIRPEIGGSSAGDLIKELDLVGYMEASGKKRTISFDPCEKFYGKNTCRLESVIEIPDAKDKQNTFFQQIVTTYQSALEDRKQTAGEYNALIELIGENIDRVADSKTASEFITWSTSIIHIWDSKHLAAIRLNEKCASLNLKYNPKSKAYETAV
jgi:hypothetical protein